MQAKIVFVMSFNTSIHSECNSVTMLFSEFYRCNEFSHCYWRLSTALLRITNSIFRMPKANFWKKVLNRQKSMDKNQMQNPFLSELKLINNNQFNRKWKLARIDSALGLIFSFLDTLVRQSCWISELVGDNQQWCCHWWTLACHVHSYNRRDADTQGAKTAGWGSVQMFVI